jgi:hypothetical protein
MKVPGQQVDGDATDLGVVHSSAWLLQAEALADLLGETDGLEEYRNRLKTIIIPGQVAENGRVPRELGRTKPYSYSLFNWDLLGVIAQVLSTPEDNLGEFTSESGLGMRLAMEFIYPLIKDQSSWPHDLDIVYHDEWPGRRPTLLFTGLAYQRDDYIKKWAGLEPRPTVYEVIRNSPIRQPRLWLDEELW